MTAFRVGMKVVAIKAPDGLKKFKHPDSKVLQVGVVYTIRGIQTALRSSGEVQTGLIFEEFVNPKVLTRLGWFELDYDHRCFRPVVSRPTSIAIFQEMLSGKRVGERV